jgi:hypothetical protein
MQKHKKKGKKMVMFQPRVTLCKLTAITVVFGFSVPNKGPQAHFFGRGQHTTNSGIEYAAYR